MPRRKSPSCLVLFGITVTLDVLAANHTIEIPAWFKMGGIDDARAILSAMMGCVSTVLALIFSVALLVLSMVATLFGPRLLYRFVQDWVTQATIGVFMRAFIYVFLVFLVTHKDESSTFIPQVSLITSWFVVLFAFSFLAYYSHRIAVLIQNPDAIARIVGDLRISVHMIVQRHANQRRGRGGDQEQDASSQTLPYQAKDAGILQSPQGGYVQEINCQAIRDAAVTADSVVCVLFRPGQFVLPGEPLDTFTGLPVLIVSGNL